MHTEPAKTYWFPAKRYGWGWGPPVTWQGWMVTVIWVLAFAVGMFRLRHSAHQLFSIPLFALFMAAVMTLVCYLTGEPPRWRWGDRPGD